jgi:hypothetical protein
VAEIITKIACRADSWLTGAHSSGKKNGKQEEKKRRKQEEERDE